jgi:penicillin-binding protein-related factor A (putative recombinase)
MQKGKKLENEVKKYLKLNADFYHKFTDSFGARGMAAPVPADFIIFSPHGKAILLECKESEKQRIPLTAFRPAQWKSMKQCSEVESCSYYIVIAYGDGYYLIHASEILKILDNEEKSIPIVDMVRFDTINKVMDFMFGENCE